MAYYQSNEPYDPEGGGNAWAIAGTAGAVAAIGGLSYAMLRKGKINKFIKQKSNQLHNKSKQQVKTNGQMQASQKPTQTNFKQLPPPKQAQASTNPNDLMGYGSYYVSRNGNDIDFQKDITNSMLISNAPKATSPIGSMEQTSPILNNPGLYAKNQQLRKKGVDFGINDLTPKRRSVAADNYRIRNIANQAMESSYRLRFDQGYTTYYPRGSASPGYTALMRASGTANQISKVADEAYYNFKGNFDRYLKGSKEKFYNDLFGE